jgi:Gliding motility associated protein GldN
MSKHILLLVLSAVLMGSYSIGQTGPCKQPKPTCADDTFSIRDADVMWRKRLLLRIDLQEKANLWITRGELYQQSTIDVNPTRTKYTDQGLDVNKEGLIRSLFKGWERGSIGAYDPNELLCPLTYTEFIDIVQGTGVAAPKDSAAAAPADELGDDFGDFGGDELGGDDFGGDFGSEFTEDATADATPTAAEEKSSFEDSKQEYEFVMYVIEDRLFDKVRSEVRNNILYLVLIQQVPGSGDIRARAAFKYCEIREFLQTVEVRNRFDDSGGKTAAEVFENHLYIYLVAEYGSDFPPSLWAAEQRNQQMVEFEHHLWSY